MFAVLSGALSTTKIVAGAIIAVIAAGSLWYVTSLRADLAQSEANNKLLQSAIQEQREVIEMLKVDVSKIQEANNQLDTLVEMQNREIKDLIDRFNTSANGSDRDVGKITTRRPTSVQRIVNKATSNVLRCLEIASGAALTESERNASKPSEINKECSSIANPSYNR